MTSCSIEIAELFIFFLQKDPRLLQLAAEDVLDTMIDEIILGVITFFLPVLRIRIWKSNKQKLFVGVLKVNDKKEQDPDPLVRGMDPRIRIWIHTKMSRVRNTVFNR